MKAQSAFPSKNKQFCNLIPGSQSEETLPEMGVSHPQLGIIKLLKKQGSKPPPIFWFLVSEKRANKHYPPTKQPTSLPPSQI